MGKKHLAPVAEVIRAEQTHNQGVTLVRNSIDAKVWPLLPCDAFCRSADFPTNLSMPNNRLIVITIERWKLERSARQKAAPSSQRKYSMVWLLLY